MAAQEFIVQFPITAADYKALKVLLKPGVNDTMNEILGRSTVRVLGRLVMGAVSMVTVAEPSTVVKYSDKEWMVTGVFDGGPVGEIVALAAVSGTAKPKVVSGTEVDKITSVDGGDLLWLVAELPDVAVPIDEPLVADDLPIDEPPLDVPPEP